MPTPKETVEALEALDPTTLTPVQRTALASARNAVRQSPPSPPPRARAYDPGTCPSDEPTAALLWRVMHDPGEESDVRIRATLGFWKIQEDQRARGGDIAHVVTFRGGVDELAPMAAESPTDEWIRFAPLEPLEELGERIRVEINRRRSKPT